MPTALTLVLLLPNLAEAHSFGRSYNLPVPLWLYAWGAAAALALSFLLIGWFLGETRGAKPPADRPLPATWTLWSDRLVLPLRLLAVALLLLAIVSGFFGTPDPFRNFGMTWFWIVFVLGLAYVAALVGNVFAVASPWAALAAPFRTGWRPYPARLAHWPALLLFMGFIWLELFGDTTPRALAGWLLGYTALTLLGCRAFGTRDWLRHGEFFGVFFRLLGKMAPLHRRDGRLHLRWPVTGLLASSAPHVSVLLFVLFMLSSTAFDGLHATEPWFALFWSEPLAWLRELAGHHPTEAYAKLRRIHRVFDTLALLLSPLLYLGAYLMALALARRLAGSAVPLQTLALRFAYSLLPIAFVYHFTHYFTLLLTQGSAAVGLLSDPLGRGWNLFGTAGFFPFWLPDMALVWHLQVGLILAGHVASVWLAHVEALRLFGSRRAALLSQVPMLVLMMGFTVAGLWILSLPLQGG